MDVITEEGTIVVPTHSSSYTDPSKWENPPVPESWWQVIYDNMPLFDPQITPTEYMGQIAETFRTFPGVLRSYHPNVSFAAWGKNKHITENHSLEYSLGNQSPLARIYDLNGWVLLLGVGYDRNTSFHLAECRVSDPPLLQCGAPMLVEGKKVWKSYVDIDYYSDDFIEIGNGFERESNLVKNGFVGSAKCKLLPQKSAVDFAKEWIDRNRKKVNIL